MDSRFGLIVLAIAVLWIMLWPLPNGKKLGQASLEAVKTILS